MDTILAELVSDAEALHADRKALDVLIFALSLATINHLTFTNHLQVDLAPLLNCLSQNPLWKSRVKFNLFCRLLLQALNQLHCQKQPAVRRYDAGSLLL